MLRGTSYKSRGADDERDSEAFGCWLYQAYPTHDLCRQYCVRKKQKWIDSLQH